MTSGNPARKDVWAYVVVNAERSGPEGMNLEGFPRPLPAIGTVLVTTTDEGATWIREEFDGPLRDVISSCKIGKGSVVEGGDPEFPPVVARALALVQIGGNGEAVIREFAGRIFEGVNAIIEETFGTAPTGDVVRARVARLRSDVNA